MTTRIRRVLLITVVSLIIFGASNLFYYGLWRQGLACAIICMALGVLAPFFTEE